MLLPDPDPFWLHRWHALRDAIDHTCAAAAERPPFQQLLTALRDFAARQFTYFFVGFSHDLDKRRQVELYQQAGLQGAPQRLAKDHGSPPDYVLRATLDQVAHDFELIQRALHQHLHAPPAQKETLARAANWARALLRPLTPEGGESTRVKLLHATPTPLFYFNRSPRIRVIPYAHVALVGIPHTGAAAGRRRDLLLIPHELGHYIYHHGQFDGAPLPHVLRDLAQGQPPYIAQWLEEIFADVCGLLIGLEPAVVPAALDMIRDNAPAAYLHDNRVHPLDAARVEIYVSALRFVETVTGRDLDPIWDTLRRRVAALDRMAGGFETVGIVNRHGERVYVPLAQLRSAVSATATHIAFDVILPAYRVKKWRDHLPPQERDERDEDASPSSVAGFVRRFRPQITMLQASGLRDVFEDRQSAALFQDWYARFEENFDARPASQEDDATLPDHQPPQFFTVRDTDFKGPLDPSIWKVVFAAAGWTSKGPQTGPTGAWEGEPDWTLSAFHR